MKKTLVLLLTALGLPLALCAQYGTDTYVDQSLAAGSGFSHGTAVYHLHGLGGSKNSVWVMASASLVFMAATWTTPPPRPSWPPSPIKWTPSA
ncbi:MAG: hypothetical protein HC842_05110 [Cytophagales bacterium]|nr:hypothetical protein [Cytophagales bacterium]